MGFLDRLFGSREPSSRQVAKDRLQLVLVHDRINLSPGMLDTMKDELIKVISRYVEIDADGVEVTFTQNRRESRLVADIPVRGPAPRPAPQPARKAPASGKAASSRAKAGGNG
jgi:cell division topological specificity factor